MHASICVHGFACVCVCMYVFVCLYACMCAEGQVGEGGKVMLIVGTEVLSSHETLSSQKGSLRPVAGGIDSIHLLLRIKPFP